MSPSRNRVLIACIAVFAVATAWLGGYSWVSTLVAALVSYGVFRIGIGIIGSFARPVPEPPPPGELRRVRLQFRCALCGTEVRMTAANDETPDPPRHCMEDMELVAPVLE